MAIVQKSSGVTGEWVKGSEIVSGTKVKIVSEADFIPSKFDDTKKQLVAKVRFQGVEEPKNMNINKPSQNALVDVFGEDTKNWIGQILTAMTEKVVVSGKRVVAVYLVPEGFELGEDDNGYVVIKRKGEMKPVSEPQEEVINPEDIPF